jgi:porin
MIKNSQLPSKYLSRWRFVIIILAVIILGVNPQIPVAQNILQRRTLTSNWGGLRDRLVDEGISPEAVYTGDFFYNISGGVHRSRVYLYNVDLTLVLNTTKLLNWNDAIIFLYGLGDKGDNPSENSGDIQGISTIAAYNTWKLYEAWLQQNLPATHLSLLLGLYDLNSEFDLLNSANFFLNPSHGIDLTFSQSGKNGPSIFPNTTLGFRLKWEPAISFYFQTVILNGIAGDPAIPNGTHLAFGNNDGILSTTEIGFLRTPVSNTKPASGRRRRSHIGRMENLHYQGKLGLGFWFYTARFEPVLPPETGDKNNKIRGSRGMYLITEQVIYREKNKPGQSLEIFSRVGYANPKMNRFVFYLGGGSIYTGLIPGRDKDIIGIAVAGVYNGRQYKQAQFQAGRQVDPAEWNLEFSYQVILTPWFSLQPDVQYIIHPNTDPSIQNALTVGIRTYITL